MQARVYEDFVPMKQGLLLINLGTPDSPNVKDVRRYLKEFLSDPRVVDLPTLVRTILLYGFILPFRPKRSAHAYQSIWQADGSPLLLNCLSLKEKLQTELSGSYQVALGMRYGKPSIASALADLKNCQSITVLPLFPQYSSAATGSAIESVYNTLKTYETQPHLTVIRDFYNHPGFIQSMALQIQPYIEHHDYVLFSYHGLPERQIIKGGCRAVCEGTCPYLSVDQPPCYRSQCFATSQALAQTLNLEPEQYSSTFQSRLGRTPWIKPYTDEVMPKLASQGVKNLLVACPSFTADCLETLEEIGIRGKALWLECGGENLTLVPCVNDSPAWLQGIQELLKR